LRAIAEEEMQHFSSFNLASWMIKGALPLLAHRAEHR